MNEELVALLEEIHPVLAKRQPRQSKTYVDRLAEREWEGASDADVAVVDALLEVLQRQDSAAFGDAGVPLRRRVSPCHGTRAVAEILVRHFVCVLLILLAFPCVCQEVDPDVPGMPNLAESPP